MSENKGTIEVLVHESKALEGNPLGDPSARELHVYLPPGYEEDSVSGYPVVFCLTGFTGRGAMLLNDKAFSPNLSSRLDTLINEKRIRPMIAVMPDCFTKYGGSQYINSTATGAYEDYLINELVPFVDANFRTVPDRKARAVAGKSSGGYGALIMALRHSDTFGLACSISGDCYFEMCYKPDLKKAFRAIKGDPLALIERIWDEEAIKSKDDFDGLNAIGMAACYSPNQDSPFGFDLPFDIITGAIREAVWERWREHDPVHLVEGYIENLRSMELVFIDAGTRDEFALDIGARVLSEKLREYGIPHIAEEFDDGHFNINYRYNRSFELISEVLVKNQ